MGRIAAVVADGIRRRGRFVYLRAPTGLASRPPMPNPPTLVGPVLAAPVAVGDQAMSINATSARGVLVPGDVLALGTDQYVVTSPVNSRPIQPGVLPGFDDVPFVPPATTAQPAGAQLTPTWSADKQMKAIVDAYPERLVDGKNILLFDLRVVIGSYKVATPPVPDNQLVIDGKVRTIIAVNPVFAGAELTSWTIQAR